ncbi:MAG: type III secretion system export apparatus subunit SctS [Pararobbsia sp.]
MSEILYAGQQAIWLTIVLSAPSVIVASVLGLAIGLLQTVTQLQEQTLPFAVKLFGVGACLYIGAGWAGERMVAYAVELMRFALAPAIR